MHAPSGQPGGGNMGGQPRPLVQQSNQVVKRMALLGVQGKQLEHPELRREIVKEPSITYLAFTVDRLLDHILTTACHSADEDDPDSVGPVIETLCAQLTQDVNKLPPLPTLMQLPDSFVPPKK
ncbi:hypothetical protein GNI_126000 [Gregarina niphandrodes]|uniref:Uncharacterized protein n=1 Tax=Gregarina niphandrodes TaxID=110365 RepID=A0A023B2H0_GRENI|nr:hypothetical protein GNI_126000 [Gregarina niphandrodes]EZG50350.1 hypothetical protein GNI_126000 [Gregarina niphandrodes]|eukprot:XP_011132020.1 hypothetical protein GNI_126000 [Gregarina niphandrodes]